jgi:hypothetical protein
VHSGSHEDRPGPSPAERASAERQSGCPFSYTPEAIAVFAFGQITHTLLEKAPPAIADTALEGLSAGSRRPG